ncbi:MAG: phage tail protein [Rhodocyclaceae bacterium]|nr:phage tail protein [Rhodocyclaceae bacterium]
MKKAIALRAHLTEAIPCLGKDPERLIVTIPKGKIACRLTGNLSFEWRYELNIVVIDFADHADTLMIPLLAWISTEQPDLLLNETTASEAIRFEAEIVDHQKSDIAITIDLSERVVVTGDNGVYTATHCDEPSLPDLGGPTGWVMEANGVIVVA